MEPTILAALITAAISVITSVLISNYSIKKDVDIKLAQLKEEGNRTYNEQVLSKRLDIYPAVNEIILRFMQDIRAGGIKNEHVQEMYNELKDWEIRHSLLLSFKSRASYSELMKVMRTVLHDGRTELKTLKALIDCVGKLRLALKGDLGIFRIEFKSSEDGYFQTYDQLFAHHQKEEHDKQVAAGTPEEATDVKAPTSDS